MGKYLRSAILCGISLLVFTGCGKKSANAKVTRDIFAMDTYMSLTAYGDNAAAALDMAGDRISAIESEFSATAENSDISAVNRNSGEPVTVSEDTARVISRAVTWGRLTDGALDITLYPIVKLWGFTTDESRVPNDGEIAEKLGFVGFESIKADGDSVTIPKNYAVDLGAMAKGFTADEVMAIFRENGVKSAIISLGGNVAALGTKPDGSLWRVAVKDPDAPENAACIINIADESAVTSGDYERYFEENGKRYCHIMDRRTGRPADNGLSSVTIVGGSSEDCDALSTALFVMGEKAAEEFWRQQGGFDMILITDDRRIIYTAGIKGFENLSDMTAEVIGVG